MGTEQRPPRERIVHATILCIEAYGPTGATVRRITEAAGTNVAAINYYFGSKERLFEEALAETLYEAFPKALGELRDAIAAHEGSIETGTRAFFEAYLQHAFRYPRIAIAHLRDALLDQGYGGPAVAEIRAFLDGFLHVVSPAMPHATPLEKRLAVIHVWSTMLELGMLPGLFQLPPESMTGDPMVSMFMRTLFGR